MAETKFLFAAGRAGTVAVIGARGGMGRLFVHRLKEVGLAPVELNRPLDGPEAAAGLGRADMVYLSVPYQAIVPVLDHVVPLMGPGAVLVDNCSVKVQPLKIMLDTYQGPVVGTHPLFGPSPSPKTPLRTAVVAGRDDEAAAAVTDLLERLGFGPFACTADEHDRSVAQIQGLNFVTTVSYLASAAQNEDILKYTTPSFGRRLKAARKMLVEDAELFATLFEANPYGQDAVRRFRSLLNLAAAGDLDLLVEKALWWWRDNGKTGSKA